MTQVPQEARLITIQVNKPRANSGEIQYGDISANLHNYILATPYQNNEEATVRVKKKKDWADYDELLIEAIKNRPCLWNYNLPAKARTPMILSEAWTDVVEDLEEKFDLDAIKGRWRMLKDCFRKAHKRVTGENDADIAAEVADMSEDGQKDSFRFYEEMLFLKDSGVGRRIKKPVEMPVELDQSNASLIACLMKIKGEPNYGKRKRSLLESKEFQKDLIQIITTPPEPPEKLDGIDGFLIQLGDSMRRLPAKARQELEQKISELVMESEEECQLLIVAEGEEVIIETSVEK